jgi:hypothetical protein
MNNIEIYKKLLSEFEMLDKELLKPIALVSTSMLCVALGLIFVYMLFDLPTIYVGLLLMAWSLGVSMAGRFSCKRAKMVILDIHGFKCINCAKTPNPRAIHLDFPMSYCPHCQLKY